MRHIVTALAGLALCACAAPRQPEGGVADYDALRRATEACMAEGGRLVLSRNGDVQSISDYRCDKSKVSAK